MGISLLQTIKVFLVDYILGFCLLCQKILVMRILGILSSLLFKVGKKIICESVYIYSGFLLCILFFMVLLKGQPCARCCVNAELKVGAVGGKGFRRTEMKVEREDMMEVKAPVGIGVIDSPLGAESQSRTSG